MKKTLIGIIIICCALGFTLTVDAAEVDPNVKAILEADKHIQGVERAGHLYTGNELDTLVGKIIFGLMGIIGVIALLFFLYGGIMWMTSEGADDVLKKAQKTMIWAAIGLVAVFLSYAVVVQVFSFSEELFPGDVTIDPSNPGAFDGLDDATQRASEPVDINTGEEINYDSINNPLSSCDPNDLMSPMEERQRFGHTCD